MAKKAEFSINGHCIMAELAENVKKGWEKV
jgi:hypothetical protein